MRKFGLTVCVTEAAAHSRLPSGTRASDPATVAASWTSSYPRSHGLPLNPARARGRQPLPLTLCSSLCFAWRFWWRVQCRRARVCSGAMPRAWGGGLSPREREAPASRVEGKAGSRSDDEKRRLSSIHELLWKMLSALGTQRFAPTWAKAPRPNIVRKERTRQG